MKIELRSSKFWFVLAALIFVVYFFVAIPYGSNNGTNAISGNWCVKNIKDNDVMNNSQLYNKSSGLREENNTILIFNEYQLGYWAYCINNNLNSYQSKNVKLMNNIDLSAHYWTPIKEFTKTFDGQSYAIKNMNISTKEYLAGFFANVGATGKVQNIVFTNCSVTKVVCRESGDNFDTDIGFVSADCSGKIENCRVYNSGSTTSYSAKMKKLRFGGITGYLTNSGFLKNCYSNINIQYSYSTINQADIGGIVGEANGSTKIELCSSESKFENINYITKICAGGIAGSIKGKCEITKSCNYGSIQIGERNNRTIETAYVGGVVGFADCETGKGSIQFCYNRGIVNSFIKDQIVETSEDKYIKTMTDNYIFTYKDDPNNPFLKLDGYAIRLGNFIKIKTPQSPNYVGGVVGYIKNMNAISSCYNSGELEGSKIMVTINGYYVLTEYIRSGCFTNVAGNHMTNLVNSYYTIVSDIFCSLDFSIPKNVSAIVGGGIPKTFTNLYYRKDFFEINIEKDTDKDVEFALNQSDHAYALLGNSKLCSNCQYDINTYWQNDGSEYWEGYHSKVTSTASEMFSSSKLELQGGTIYINYNYCNINGDSVEYYEKNSDVYTPTKQNSNLSYVSDLTTFKGNSEGVFEIDSTENINGGNPYIKEMYWQSEVLGNPPPMHSFEWKFVDSNQTAILKKVSVSGNPTIIEVPQIVVHNGNLYEVREVGDHAFDDLDIIEVVLPNTITKIGVFAFQGCEKLTNINMPTSLTVISVGAFYKCRKLQNVQLPNGLKTIGDLAFASCNAFSEIIVPNSVTAIGNEAFASINCLQKLIVPFIGATRGATGEQSLFGYWFGTTSGSNYTKVEQKYSSSSPTISSYIPTSLKKVQITDIDEIKPYTFNGCKIDCEIQYPLDRVKKIGDCAFYGSNVVKYINLDSITYIGVSAFENCTSLNEIYTDTGLLMKSESRSITIGANAFKGCALLEYVALINNITSIGDGAFNGCENLLYVNWPTGTNKIQNGTFYGCSSLTEIGYYQNKKYKKNALPTNVTTIGDNAFKNCKKLNKLTLSSSIQSIRNNAFEGCIKLVTITYENTTAKWNTITKGTNYISKGVKIKCTDGEITIS